MSMTDDDIQELEAYLDGELSPEEEARLRIRLKTQDGLAGELQDLRTERTLRGSILAQCIEHPGDAEACDRLILSLRTVAASEALRRRWGQRLRYGSALAACLVVGLTTGLLMRNETPATPLVVPGAVANVTPAYPLPGGSPVTPLVTVDNPIQPIPVAQVPRSPRQGAVVLTVTDPSGRVVAQQQFDSIEAAHRFADDLKRSKTRQPQGGVQAVPVWGEF